MPNNNTKNHPIIPKDKIRALKNKIPRGSYKIIAKETGFSYWYVSEVMNGKKWNKVIIDRAIEIGKRHGKAIAEAEKQIAEL